MNQYVFHITLEPSQLPEDDGEKNAAAKTIAANLTGQNQGWRHFLQYSDHLDNFRLTIMVPEDMESALEKLTREGYFSIGEEPTLPEVNGNTAVIPSSYQFDKAGLLIHPRSVESNPERLLSLAQLLADAGLPNAFHDYRNWADMDHDEEIGTFFVTLYDPKIPEPEIFVDLR